MVLGEKGGENGKEGEECLERKCHLSSRRKLYEKLFPEIKRIPLSPEMIARKAKSP